MILGGSSSFWAIWTFELCRFAPELLLNGPDYVQWPKAGEDYEYGEDDD